MKTAHRCQIWSSQRWLPQGASLFFFFFFFFNPRQPPTAWKTFSFCLSFSKDIQREMQVIRQVKDEWGGWKSQSKSQLCLALYIHPSFTIIPLHALFNDEAFPQQCGSIGMITLVGKLDNLTVRPTQPRQLWERNVLQDIHCSQRTNDFYDPLIWVFF